MFSLQRGRRWDVRGGTKCADSTSPVPRQYPGRENTTHHTAPRPAFAHLGRKLRIPNLEVKRLSLCLTRHCSPRTHKLTRRRARSPTTHSTRAAPRAQPPPRERTSVCRPPRESKTLLPRHASVGRVCVSMVRLRAQAVVCSREVATVLLEQPASEVLPTRTGDDRKHRGGAIDHRREARGDILGSAAVPANGYGCRSAARGMHAHARG